MPVDPKLLDVLACPSCKRSVRLTQDGQGLLCESCRRIYPIQDDDTPVMLIEESRQMPVSSESR